MLRCFGKVVCQEVKAIYVRCVWVGLKKLPPNGVLTTIMSVTMAIWVH